MMENCGYEGCYPMVDFLTGKHLSIRIQSENHEKSNIFLILTDFMVKGKGYFKLDPSRFVLDLTNGKILIPKVIPCSGTLYDLSYLRSVPGLEGPIVIEDKRGACVRLFFDEPPPTVEETFILRIAGVTMRGEPVDIPEVIFRKGISRY